MDSERIIQQIEALKNELIVCHAREIVQSRADGSKCAPLVLDLTENGDTQKSNNQVGLLWMFVLIHSRFQDKHWTTMLSLTSTEPDGLSLAAATPDPIKREDIIIRDTTSARLNEASERMKEGLISEDHPKTADSSKKNIKRGQDRDFYTCILNKHVPQSPIELNKDDALTLMHKPHPKDKDMIKVYRGGDCMGHLPVCFSWWMAPLVDKGLLKFPLVGWKIWQFPKEKSLKLNRQESTTTKAASRTLMPRLSDPDLAISTYKYLWSY
ncbi:hypothetical protein PROFUN_16849 [Planoprotostelium fungivorum]|uniref:Uncharacterized protein n=1 Tax=Planoprotostelium fungivorum TaxID=1890364 RepID=A0A2P6MNM3_9EUKA|nr:hypothetical protein PROFUN_16849 [Planoprotostelium fungivorum]